MERVEKNNGKGKTIILIVIIIVLLLVVGYFVYDKFFKKDVDEKISNNNTNNPTDATIINQEPADSDMILKLYESIDSDYYTIQKEGYTGDIAKNYKYLATYNCINSNCKGYSVSPVGTKAIVYDDSKYYLYNYGNKRKEELTLGNEVFSEIKLLYSKRKNYGLFVVNDNNKGAFYNLDQKKYITDFVYNFADTSNIDELLDNNYFVGQIETSNNGYATDVINNVSGNVITTLKDYGLSSAIVGDATLYFGYSPMGYVVSIYNSNFKPFTGSDTLYYYAINSNNTITISEKDNDKIYYIYDENGKKIYTSSQYKQVVKVVKDYIVILDNDDNLKLLDKNEKEITTFLKVASNYTVHSMISGWYTENGKNGIYMVVENKDIPYGTEGSGLEYYYIPSTNETGVIKTEGVGGYAKPVLYLYPTERTNVTVSFEKPYLLTTTYPKYKDNWSVVVEPNGDLYGSNNQYYYGLYWEELGSTKVKFDKGFYVTKENAIKFLEDKTEEIGFTRREANEFIMYWLPILEKNEKNLVYFELTEERESYNKLKINPLPDSILRVAIHVKKVDEETKIEEQKITKFERKGFSVVEWGGVVH